MHEGHSALQLQHPHDDAVTVCGRALVHAQAQRGVLALDGGTGTKRGVVDGSGGPFSGRGSPPPAVSQAKTGHTPRAPLKASGPDTSSEGPGSPRRQSRLAGTGARGWSPRGGRAHLVAEALLEAHRDAIEQAPPWRLGQLSLTVCQVGGHTVGPFVYFPGLEEGEMDTRQSEIGLLFLIVVEYTLYKIGLLKDTQRKGNQPHGPEPGAQRII